MADVRIYTSRSCGWAVRNYAALIEKGIAFDTLPAKRDDGTKLAEFLALTPYGRTPVLRCDGTAVFESWLINEFIDERFPDPPLMPSGAGERCASRQWTYYCENTLLPALTTVARTPRGAAADRAIDALGDALDWFAANAMPAGWDGPYYFGKAFSLLDLVFSTLFRTARELEQVLGVSLPMGDTSMRRWAGQIAARPSVCEAERIQERLEF